MSVELTIGAKYVCSITGLVWVLTSFDADHCTIENESKLTITRYGFDRSFKKKNDVE